MADSYEEKYTAPDLRREIKDELMDSDKGGEPGQWSARKSQMLVKEYERRGGGYRQDEKDEAAKSLEEWTAQDWQTIEGSADADDEGTMKRYLPAKIWAMLTDEQANKAEQTKIKTSDKGQQYADWPDFIKRAMVAAGFAENADADPTLDDLQTWARQLDISGRSDMNKDDLMEAIRDADVDESNASTQTLAESATKEELYERAQALEISGRSKMDKAELAEAVQEAEG